MTRSILAFAVILVPILLTTELRGVPMAPMEMSIVEGTIAEVVWHPERVIPARPGMSGSAGVERLFPAHFEVRLDPFEAKPARRSTTTRSLPLAGGNGRLRLNHFQPDYLKKGMRIKVTGYQMRGDEGGVWTGYGKLEILQPAENDTTADESPRDLTLGTASFVRPLMPGREVSVTALATSTGPGTAENVVVDLVLHRGPVPRGRTRPAGALSDSPRPSGHRIARASASFDGACTVSVSLRGRVPDDILSTKYSLSIVVDPGNQVEEAREDNNVATVPVGIKSPLK